MGSVEDAGGEVEGGSLGGNGLSADDIRDQLPEDLDASGFVEAGYNSAIRRKV